MHIQLLNEVLDNQLYRAAVQDLFGRSLRVNMRILIIFQPIYVVEIYYFIIQHNCLPWVRLVLNLLLFLLTH